MKKIQALTSLGQSRLLIPTWIKSALVANDRLKVCFTVLQAAAAQAQHPKREAPDLIQECAVVGLADMALHALITQARQVDKDLHAPDLDKLLKTMQDDLATMAKPVLQTSADQADLRTRVQHWLDWLGALMKPPADRLSDAQLLAITSGQRGKDDSLHLLVMDLHKRINQLAGSLASEVIDGARVWELQDADRLRVAAFMRGLNRTAVLKFDHPGLETVATRDGERLLIQNDIGTNDAHVLVLQIINRCITLTYSDLHRKRFEFFQALLAPFGANWSGLESRTDAALNQGNAYTVGTAHFDCADESALDAALEGVGSRVVFLIDWNHARKRLQSFISKPDAIAVLAQAAQQEVGHRAWIQAGGESLIFEAMQAAGEGAFRIGERLDDIIGASDAQAFLLAVMHLACEALRRGQPTALVADETLMLLAQYVRRRSSEFDLLAEHAAYCQALAQAVSDALARGSERSDKAAQNLAARAKVWERKADHLVMKAREKAQRQPRWRPVAKLVEQSDDVADALEEAAFLIGLIADHHKGWNDEVRKSLSRLADTVLQATQDQVKALAIARTLGTPSEATDNDAFLRATWRVLQAERQCDGLLRDARRVILAALPDAGSLMLATDLANTLELASDCLLAAAYALRELAFDKAGVQV